MKSWFPVSSNSDFSIHNIPFGIGTLAGGRQFVCTRIGDHVLNLSALASTGFFNGLVHDLSVFDQPVLNNFIRLGKAVTNEVRAKIQHALSDANSALKQSPQLFRPIEEIVMHLPVHIGDYTDFYSSIEHATNVGKMFRDPENALLPNWKHLPVGYHGRSSSIVVSGTPIHRPRGQVKPKDAESPVFIPTQKLDFELEMGFIIGKDTYLGSSISTAVAEDYIFGLVLFNDWSARDIQAWEYVPLGPFLAKNFASSMSPWIVTLEALNEFRVPGAIQEPQVLPYLEFEDNRNYDVALEVSITPAGHEEIVVTRSNFKYMYWNMCQQLAHHTSNGCNVRVGDLMASGTISGHDQGSFGSMLEICWGGKNPITLSDGKLRSFIEDGDMVIMRGWAENKEKRIGFGEVYNRIVNETWPGLAAE
ncbi:MAG TPA: fumarylacetoacetase [Saprospiraceae bacterium]|nr:fumarylacetoacetase [Saprospiraceae bacterium]